MDHPSLGEPGPGGPGRLARNGWPVMWRAGRRWPRCRWCHRETAAIGPERILWCPTCDIPADVADADGTDPLSR